MRKKLERDLSLAANPDQFVFHASDEKGHSAHVRVNLPTETVQVTAEIIAKGNFPYRTREDLIRDAVYHRLSELVEMGNLGCGDQLRRVEATDYILKQEAAAKRFLDQMQKLDSVITSAGDSAEHQAEIVNAILDQVNQMPDTYWRNRYRCRIQERHGHLIRSRLSLKPSTFLEDTGEDA